MCSLKDYEVIRKIGQGSFGVVYRVKSRKDSHEYVLKQIDLGKLDPRTKACAMAEGKILKQLRSRYVVDYHNSFVEKNYLNIVMEFCAGGDLAHHLKTMMGRPLKEDQVWKFFIQMVLGIADLHTKKILHRDIKAMNIFLTKDQEIRIGDLGVAKEMKQDFTHTIVGTPYYLSPEMCEEKPYNEKTDIWALGCILYELCTGDHPFDANNQAALALKIIMGKYKPIPSTYSADIGELVSQCLSTDHKRRPTARHILAKEIIQEKIQQLKIRTDPRKEKEEGEKEEGEKELELKISEPKGDRETKKIEKSKSSRQLKEKPEPAGNKLKKPPMIPPAKEGITPPKKVEKAKSKETSRSKEKKHISVQPKSQRKEERVQSVPAIPHPPKVQKLVSPSVIQKQQPPLPLDPPIKFPSTPMTKVIQSLQQHVDDAELEQEFGVKRHPYKTFSLQSEPVIQDSLIDNSISRPQANDIQSQIPQLLEENEPFQDEISSQQDNIYLIEDKQKSHDENMNFLLRKLQENKMRENQLKAVIQMKEGEILKKLPLEEYNNIKSTALKANEDEIEKVVSKKGLWKTPALMYAFYKVLQSEVQVEDCQSRIRKIEDKIKEAHTKN